MNHEAKDHLIAQFRAYLDYLDTVEGVYPAAAEEDRAIDLFTLFSELSALKNEVKLESRQVKTALDQFREVFDTLREDNARLGEELGRRHDTEQAARLAAQRELLLESLELRDRLAAGLDQARRYRPGLWLRLSRRDLRFFRALSEGIEITLRRIDELLSRYGVVPLAAVGTPFDAHSMRALGLEAREDQPEGIVLAELRKGYLKSGEVLRPAEVIVNKRKS